MLQVKNLNKTINGQIILSGITFGLSSNEILGVIGPSGSGKTSLLRIIAGLDEPTAGEIRLYEKVINNPYSLLSPQKREIGFVFQDLALWPHMNAGEHLEFVLQSRGFLKKETREKTEYFFQLAKFPLERIKAYPRELSGGEKQRLALARSLSQEPKIILLDEPLSNIDELLKEEILAEFKTLQKTTGIPFLYVAHDFREILEISVRILVLNQGGVSYLGSKNEIPADTPDPYLKLLNSFLKKYQ